MDLHVEEECELFGGIALFIFKLFMYFMVVLFCLCLNNSLKNHSFNYCKINRS